MVQEIPQNNNSSPWIIPASGNESRINSRVVTFVRKKCSSIAPVGAGIFPTLLHVGTVSVYACVRKAKQGCQDPHLRRFKLCRRYTAAAVSSQPTMQTMKRTQFGVANRSSIMLHLFGSEHYTATSPCKSPSPFLSFCLSLVLQTAACH